MKKIVAVCVVFFFPAFFFWTVPCDSAPLLSCVHSAGLTLYMGGGVFFETEKGEIFSLTERDKFRRAKGEEIRFSKDAYPPQEVLALYGARILKEERVDGVCIWYCAAEGLSRAYRLPQGRVNLQIAFSEEAVTVGFPVIYGGF